MGRIMIYYAPIPQIGDIAQLVERLNGIEKVRGSTPLISTTKVVLAWVGAMRGGSFARALRGELCMHAVQRLSVCVGFTAKMKRRIDR